MQNRTVRPYLVLLVGVIAVSFASILIRFCQAPTLVIASYSLGLASLFFIVLTASRHRYPFRGFGRRDSFLAAASGVFLSVHFVTWIASLRYTSVASSVVLVATSPIFVALGSALILREKVPGLVWAGTFLSVIGGVIIGAADWSRDGLRQGPSPFAGDALALAGAVMGGGYFLIGRVLRGRIDTLPYVTAVYSTAAVVLISLALGTKHRFGGYPPVTYLLFLLIAFVPQVIGHTSFNWALRRFPAPVVAVTILGEPIGATLLAYGILGEPLTVAKAAGGSLILVGVYLALRASPGRLARKQA